MDVKQDYQGPISAPLKKTWLDVFISIISFILIPFKFASRKIVLLKEDNAKINKFRRWSTKENTRHRRGLKLNDEF